MLEKVDSALEERIERAARALGEHQQPDGHWVFELECDATLPSEYILMRHFRGEPVDAELERKVANYLRRIQSTRHGGWPLFHDGDFDMSASVKAYFALKLMGDSADADHMRRAREAIRARGGAARANVFTRTYLALYGQISWRSVPVMPVEIALLPRWFPFHLDKISYWSRTVIAPLIVLLALKPQAKNPKGVRIDELFLDSPDDARMLPRAPHQNRFWFAFFRMVDHLLRAIEPTLLRRLPTRRRAIKAAEAFTIERLNGEDGIGAIFPAMMFSVLMLDVLGYPADHPLLATARRSVEKLKIEHEDEAYYQACWSPVWDTGLACHAMLEAGGERAVAQVDKALGWLKTRQILDVKGDWASTRPDVRPGGWAFQYNNPHYPDVDDTAVVAMAMERAQNQQGRSDHRESISRAREWIFGMQSRNGGWGAFDADNSHDYLNHIPFADHGALLDPPTEDVSARCVSMLAQLGDMPKDDPRMAHAVDYLRRTQHPEGSWFGRWGMNYIYGTWSVLSALNAAGVDHRSTETRKAVDWLVRIQNPDGGWGEDGSSYKLDYKGYEPAPSAPSQTAWALLGLMAAGEIDHPAVARGIAYLSRMQGEDGLWAEERFTAVGFPRILYLRYHGYAKYFPVWAMARYRNLRNRNARAVAFGL